MSKDFGAAVAVAVYQALQNDSVLTAMIQGIYSIAPRGTALPYIVLGEQRAQDLPSKTRAGQRIRYTIEIWTATAGSYNSQLIAAEVVRVLQAASMAVTGASTAWAQLQDTRVTVENRQQIIKQTLTFIVTVQE